MMASRLRAITLSSTETRAPNGVRVRTKEAEKAICEACNDNTTKTLTAGINGSNNDATSQNEGWCAGALAFPPGLNSALCSFAWGSWKLSVIYQDQNNDLREQRHVDGQWQSTDFVQPGALQGTSVACVHSEGARRVVIFFQDRDGFICYRTATDLVWNKESVKLVHAAPGTGIGATCWGNLDDIRVYYQDKDNVVREHRGNFDGKWARTDFSKQYSRVIGDITDVSSGKASEMRLYMQDGANSVREFGSNGLGGQNGWSTGESTVASYGDVSSVTSTETGDCGSLPVLSAAQGTLPILSAAHDQVPAAELRTGSVCALPAMQKWPMPMQATAVRTTGNYGGDGEGERPSSTPRLPTLADPTTDEAASLRAKRITRVRVRSGHVVDALQLDFADGSATDYHAGTGGGEHAFELAAEEDIVRVTCVAGQNCTQRLQFETSFGRFSDWYGLEQLDVVSPWYSATPQTQVWYDGGRALAGFLGCNNEYLPGLAPVWSDRISFAGLTTLADIESETTRLEAKLGELHARCAAMQDHSDAHGAGARDGLGPRGAEVAEALAVLVEAVEYLHDLGATDARARHRATQRREADVRAKVAVCREDADTLRARFVALAEAVVDLRPTGDVIHGNIAQLLAEANATDGHIANMITWSREYQELTMASKLDKERGIQIMTENIARDKIALEAARDAAERDAQPNGQQQTPNSARQNVFTDVLADTSSAVHSNLVNDVAVAEHALEEDEAQLAALQTMLAAVHDKLVGVEAVLVRLTALREDIATVTTTIAALLGDAGETREKGTQYETVLAQIVAAFAPLDAAVALSAKDFAAVLLEIVNLIMPATYLGELLVFDAESLQAAMEEILQFKV